MIRWRKTAEVAAADTQIAPPVSGLDTAPARGDLYDWVLSLPWVLEAPTDGTQRGVRLFGVDCAPLQRRQMWLVTGLEPFDKDATLGIAAVMPLSAVRSAKALGWVVLEATPLPAGHGLVMLQNESTAECGEIEAFVLTAYAYAMS